MFARMSTIQGKAESIENGIKEFKELTVPEIKQMAGLKEAVLMVDRKKGKSLAITFWDTEKDLVSSSAAAAKLRAQADKTAGAAQPPTVETYEVAVKV